MTLPKSLAYRRAARLRTIRQMRADLFRELNRFSLCFQPNTPQFRALHHVSPIGPYVYYTMYLGYPLKGTYSGDAAYALERIATIKQRIYLLGLIRIQEAVKDV